MLALLASATGLAPELAAPPDHTHESHAALKAAARLEAMAVAAASPNASIRTPKGNATTAVLLPSPSPGAINLLQTGGYGYSARDTIPISSAFGLADAAALSLQPTPAPFDILTAQPLPHRGGAGWGAWPPEQTAAPLPEPPPAPVPLFSLRLVDIGLWATNLLRVTPCKPLLEDAVLAVGLGGPSEEYHRVNSSKCVGSVTLQDGQTASVLEIRLQKPLRFEHGDGDHADAMPHLFQIPTAQLHARWEPPKPPEYYRALALATRAQQWVSSHAARPVSQWAPRDIALCFALSLFSLSVAMMLLACCLLCARFTARWWTLKRVTERRGVPQKA